MKKIILLIIGVLLVFVILSGCTTKKQQTQANLQLQYLPW